MLDKLVSYIEGIGRQEIRLQAGENVRGRGGTVRGILSGPVSHQMMEVEHCFFERSWVPHYKKTLFPKSEPLKYLVTLYFQNGSLIKKKHVISLKGHFFVIVRPLLSVNRNVYTTISKRIKNEFCASLVTS